MAAGARAGSSAELAKSPCAALVGVCPGHQKSYLADLTASRERPSPPVSSHPLGDFEDEPAEDGDADAPEEHDRDHSLLLFLHDVYGLSRRVASNKLLVRFARREQSFPCSLRCRRAADKGDQGFEPRQRVGDHLQFVKEKQELQKALSAPTLRWPRWDAELASRARCWRLDRTAAQWRAQYGRPGTCGAPQNRRLPSMVSPTGQRQSRRPSRSAAWARAATAAVQAAEAVACGCPPPRRLA